nr:hypothetical protein OG690_38525 [Streptomyces tubercidicus]
MNRDIQDILKRVKKQGFAVRMNAKRHYRVTSPGGDTVTVPSTPSDQRSVKNVRSKLRKIGAVL